MEYKRILTIQDISCVGQCSLTVALPILSACGVETCILPTAVLSTHTTGFNDFTVRDLAQDVPAIRQHWEKEGILFDAIYTGYLGSVEQIDNVKDVISSRVRPGGPIIIDPAMADNGRLYPAFDAEYVEQMKRLCFAADILLPNITEACLLTDMPYQTQYDSTYIRELVQRLVIGGAKQVVLTGVSYRPETTGVAIYGNGEMDYYEHRRISKGSHGTGDVYASAFAGALMRGKSPCEAARIAADYTVLCIERTQDDPEHWYGVKFEPELPELIRMLSV